MTKPNFASVTEVRCSCRYLEESVKRPKLPIRFNEQFNEYYIEGGSSADGAQAIIYHCPFCGGAAPESKRGAFFATIPAEEARRLWALLQDVKTIDDVLRILGAPDQDFPLRMPEGWPTPTKDRDGKKYEATRSLTYSQLSTVADVQFTVYSNGEVESTVGGKYTGASTSGA